MTSPAGVGSARFHTGGRAGPADSVYLGVYRRAALERVGGYDESYLRAEDWEMNHRIRQAGGLIWFQPRLQVTYRPRATVTALARQYFHYGRWRRVVARQHAGTINLRYLAPPVTLLVIVAGLAAGLAGLAGGVIGPWPALSWLALGLLVPVAYLAGILAVTATAARRLAGPALVRLPVVLATMHLAWGFGFLTSPRRLGPGLTRPRLRPPGTATMSAPGRNAASGNPPGSSTPAGTQAGQWPAASAASPGPLKPGG
jgi:hypothetical protein